MEEKSHLTSQEFCRILRKRKSLSKFSYDESTLHAYSVLKEHNYSNLEGNKNYKPKYKRPKMLLNCIDTTEKASKNIDDNDDGDSDSLPDWLKTVSSSDEEFDSMDHVPGLRQLLKLESEKTASHAVRPY